MAFESEDHIRVRAYHIWEANGRPEGRDLEFWEQARQPVPQAEPAAGKKRAQSSNAASAPAKGAKGGRRRARKSSE
jgi:Protein of unknown function (DUF2934)